MTLTPTQKTIIRLMREGWEIARNRSFLNHHAWMQKGIGCGGKSKEVNTNTLSALIKKDCIHQTRTSTTNIIYTLTDKGRTVNID